MIEANDIVTVEANDDLDKIKDKIPDRKYGYWDENFGEDGHLWLVVDSKNNIIYIKTTYHYMICEYVSPNVYRIFSIGEGYAGERNNQHVADLDCKLIVKKVGVKGW